MSIQAASEWVSEWVGGWVSYYYIYCTVYVFAMRKAVPTLWCPHDSQKTPKGWIISFWGVVISTVPVGNGKNELNLWIWWVVNIQFGMCVPRRAFKSSAIVRSVQKGWKSDPGEGRDCRRMDILCCASARANSGQCARGPPYISRASIHQPFRHVPCCCTPRDSGRMGVPDGQSRSMVSVFFLNHQITSQRSPRLHLLHWVVASSTGTSTNYSKKKMPSRQHIYHL